MQDALEAAHQKDRAGKGSEAIRTYRIGEQIIDEALKLDVPSVGLGPAFSNTARWRADLTAWKAQAADRSACCLTECHTCTRLAPSAVQYEEVIRISSADIALCLERRVAKLVAGGALPAPASSIPSSTEAEGWAALRRARPASTHQPQQPKHQPARPRQPVQRHTSQQGAR